MERYLRWNSSICLLKINDQCVKTWEVVPIRNILMKGFIWPTEFRTWRCLWKSQEAVNYCANIPSCLESKKANPNLSYSKSMTHRRTLWIIFIAHEFGLLYNLAIQRASDHRLVDKDEESCISWVLDSFRLLIVA